MTLHYAFGSTLRDQKFSQPDLTIFQQLYRLDTDPFLVDRTQTVSWPFGEKLLDQFRLPDLSGTPVTFQEAGIVQANSLLDRRSKIYLFWSGGIDSTFMLVSFLLTNRDLADQVVVVLNEDSIREYPAFYKNHIQGQFELMSTERAMAQASLGSLNGLFLSAEHADQLFGSPLTNVIHQRFGNGVLSTPVAGIVAVLEKFGIDQQASQCIADLYQQTFKHSPRPIETVWDWFWWHGFNFKWQMIGLKLKTRLDPTTELVTFYSGVDFQRWSVNQRPDLTNIETLKNIAKQTILDFTQDQDYFDHKIKHSSSTLYFAKANSAAITDQGKLSFAEFDPMNYYTLDNSIANWLNNQ
jgi:hypothetical protein